MFYATKVVTYPKHSASKITLSRSAGSSILFAKISLVDTYKIQEW